MNIRFDKLGGIVPVVAQDYKTGEVLMLAFMNEEAFKKTIETGRAWYYSRSKERLWQKGETSGHIQEVKEILIDCDEDAIVIKVKQYGGACHDGYNSCFYRRLENGEFKIFKTKVFEPDEVYVKDN